MFKFSAMRAATAHISRRHKVKVEVTHEHDSQSSSPHEKILFHHLYAIDKQGVITLEKSSGATLYVGESSFARKSYLLNMTPRVSSTVVTSARNAGALAVVARQFDQSVKTRAESDRALYHALGSGASLADALQWSRQTLFQSNASSYQWAALTLTTAEIKGEGPLALADFPPRFEPKPQRQESSESKSLESSSEVTSSSVSPKHELREGNLTIARRRRTLPDSADQFVRDTVMLIQRSQRTQDTQDKLSLALRTPVMRHLSERVQSRKIKPNPSLQRSAQLSQQLIEASLSEDNPLTLPSQWFGRAERLASSLGVKVDSVAQSTRSLVTSPAIWVWGSDPQTRLLLARGLCEEVFQSFPYEPVNPESKLGLIKEMPQKRSPRGSHREPVASTMTQRVTVGLSVASQLSWTNSSTTMNQKLTNVNPEASETKSLKDTAPKTTGAEDHQRRQLMVGYQPERNAWRPYERAWVIVDQAETIDLAHRRQASLALRNRELVGSTSDQESTQTAQTLSLSHDARIIYLSEHPPAQIDDAEIIIYLRPNVEQLPHLWRQKLRGELSQQHRDAAWIEEHISSPMTQSFIQILSLALELDLISVTRAYDALSYGIIVGADLESFIEAAELYVYPLADSQGTLKRDCLYAFSALDQESYDIFWREIFAERSPLELPSISLSLES
jgi:hypothetical protein